jgi:hypothetical protein
MVGVEAAGDAELPRDILDPGISRGNLLQIDIGRRWSPALAVGAGEQKK